MSLTQRITAGLDRLYLAIRHPKAFEAGHDDARARDLEGLRGHKYALLTTFKRSGEPVPTPVWFGLADGKLYFHSEAQVGKIKRIRNNPRVLVGPCTARGRPKGSMVEGRARLLGPDAKAEEALRANYGLFRRVYVGGLYGERSDIPDVYVEVAPA